MDMLSVENLWVSVDGREVLKGINLNIPVGETHILFGRNGSGKSTLLMSLMGFERYQVEQGKILFRGQDITPLPTYERARLGLGLAFQRPPTIRGVKTGDILRACSQGRVGYQALAEAYDFTPFLDREINYGFSGGEIKRSELLQLLAQGKLLQKERRRENREKSGLIITHTGFILDYIHADKAYILNEGRLCCQGHPRELLKDIKSFGYEECGRCRR